MNFWHGISVPNMVNSDASHVQNMLERVLREIKPTEDERKSTVANVNRVMAMLKTIVSRDVELRVAGSVARGTNLRGDSDIDIFMLFPNDREKEGILKKGLEYGKALARSEKRGRYEIKYAEHPYVRVYLDSMGIKIDMVPAFKVKSADELSTSVDRTPLHTEFIEANVSARQKDDVRLLKYLLKAHHIYGAETKTGGFSGYLCELLVYQYGSFLAVLRKFSELKLPIIIDPRKKSEYIDIGINKRFGSEFVVIDPVDTDRNVAAAVSEDSLSRFVLVAREFMERPSMGLFSGIKFSSTKARSLFAGLLKESGLESFLIVASVPDKSPDVIWPQLRRVLDRIVTDIMHEDFCVCAETAWVEGRNGFMLILSRSGAVKSRLLRGPDILETGSSTAFIKAHSSAIGLAIRERRVYALEHSRHASVSEILKGVVGKGGIRHKEVNLRKARIFHNSMPAIYAESAYFEIMKKLTI